LQSTQLRCIAKSCLSVTFEANTTSDGGIV
jgi:hypothetical protein